MSLLADPQGTQTKGQTRTSDARLRAEALTSGYGGPLVLDGLSVQVPDGKITAIVGPNACGKSTLLRSLARLERPLGGHVSLDGRPISQQNSRSVARRLAILSQSPQAPAGLGLRDLVLRGRTPHQTAWRQYSARDEASVETALALTGLSDLADRPLDTLSGGQRQRAWIAMALAQETEILLLDEPTTYLDLPHQIDLLELVGRLNRETGRTVAMVLHDINLAARFCDHVIALRQGRVHSEGPPHAVVTPAMMQEVFGLSCTVIADPHHGTPHIIPT